MAETDVQPAPATSQGEFPAMSNGTSLDLPGDTPTANPTGQTDPQAAAQTTAVAGASAGPAQPVLGAHTRLVAMLGALGATASATGKALSTHGKAGGAADVQAYAEQQQAIQLRAQQARIAQEQAELTKKSTLSEIDYRTAATNAQKVATLTAIQKLPYELRDAALKVEGDLFHLHMEGDFNLDKIEIPAGASPEDTVNAVFGDGSKGEIHSNAYTLNHNHDGDQYVAGGQVGKTDATRLNSGMHTAGEIKNTVNDMLIFLDRVSPMLDPGEVKNFESTLDNFFKMPYDSTLNAGEFNGFVTSFQHQVVTKSVAAQAKIQAQETVAKAQEAAEKATETGLAIQKPTSQLLDSAHETLQSYSGVLTPAQLKAGENEIKNARTVVELQKVTDKYDSDYKSISMVKAQEAFNQGQKDVVRGDMVTKTITPIWSDKGYNGTMQSVGQLRGGISAAKDGNGLLTAMVPIMEVLGINTSQGVHRISPTEAEAAKINPEVMTRINAFIDRAGQGKLSPELQKEGLQLADIVQKTAYVKAVSDTQIAAKGYGQDPSKTVALDYNGNVSNLADVQKTIVRDPQGGVHVFKTAQQADNFRKAAGL